MRPRPREYESTQRSIASCEMALVLEAWLRSSTGSRKQSSCQKKMSGGSGACMVLLLLRAHATHDCPSVDRHSSEVSFA